jgi:hypothetical protein
MRSCKAKKRVRATFQPGELDRLVGQKCYSDPRSPLAACTPAKSKPGRLNFASAGTGSGTHFAGEMLKFAAQIDVVHVPYKGIPEALTDTMTARVQLFMSPLASAIPLVKDGKLRALGAEIAPTTPAELDKLIAAEVDLAMKLARQAGIKPE